MNKCILVVYIVNLATKLTILLVHTSNLMDILSRFNTVIIELVPQRNCSEFWTRKLGQRVEVETVDSNADAQYD